MDPKQNTEHTVENLLAKNKSLYEELTQCKADKDFVWNLWKRLQTAEPDLTSVISMVVAREKEKTEDKDKKILGILQLKDAKIKELQEVLESGTEEVKYSKERYHDLLIENENLRQRLEEKKNEESKITDELKEENKYLSDLISVHKLENENIQKRFEESASALEKEIDELKTQNATLESEVDTLSQNKSNVAAVMEENTHLLVRIEELRKTLEEITRQNQEAVRQYQDATAALKLRENQLQDQSKIIREHADQLEVKNQELAKLRQELSASMDMQQEFSQHVVEQDITIKQLQSLQDDTQKVIVAREEAHSNEIRLLKKLVNELQEQCSELQEARSALQEDVERLNEINIQNEEIIRVKEEVIKELKVAVQGEKKRKSLSPLRTTKQQGVDVCGNCNDLRQRLLALEEEHEGPRERYQQKLRRISSLEKAVKVSLDRRYVDEQLPKENAIEEDEQMKDTRVMEEGWEGSRRKLAQAERRNTELKQLLELKESELVEMKRAHSQRLQRYKLLQENHKLVLEQLKTFDAKSDFQKEKELPERPSSRSLRHENSEGVWNELAYFKAEYEKLFQERHDVLEEIDVLRVQHADDQSTIQELRVCLEEDKQELQKQLSKEEKAEVEKFVSVAELEHQLSSWRDKEVRWNQTYNALEQENKDLKSELSSTLAVNEELQVQITNLQSRLSAEKRQLDKQDQELARCKEELKRAIAKIESFDKEYSELHKMKSNSPKKTQFEQQVKSIDMYDKQVKRIAEKILESPGRERVSPDKSPLKNARAIQVHMSPKREAQATQTEPVSYSDVDTETSMSEDEESKASNKTGKLARRKEKTGGTPYKTPTVKKSVSWGKSVPGKNEWSSLKQRVLSLTQQVSAIRKSKEAAVKAMNGQKEISESLQAELNHVLQRLHISKNSAQTLTEDLKKCMEEKESLLTEKKGEKFTQQSQSDWKRLEERLRTSANECSRLSYLVKSLRNENEKLKEELKECQERLSRSDRAVNQKKILVEELRTKLKELQDKSEKEVEAKKELEDKVRRITGREIQMKMQVDSLKRQLDSEGRHKRELQQQFLLCQEELKQKVRLLAQSQSLRNKAEMVVSEMESAATIQLQGLANKSEAAINQLKTKLDKAIERGEEFQAFVKTLAEELLNDIHKSRLQLSHAEEQRKRQNEAKPSMRHARDTARSILNMSSSDLEDLLNEKELEADELEKKVRQEHEWKKKLDEALQCENSFAVPLVETLLDILEEKTSLQVQLNHLAFEAGR